MPEKSIQYRLLENVASPYSAKLRAYLHYKEIPYQREKVNWFTYMEKIPKLVGMPIIPVILTSDGQVMQDTTPMLEWFEEHFPARACIPDDAGLAFLMWLLEDFADEYLVRFSVHYRWNNPMNQRALSHRLARTLIFDLPDFDHQQVAAMILARQTQFLKTLGLDSEAAQADLEKQCAEFLAILENHFKTHAFLFGERPSLADFAFYGQLWGHLYKDPFSAEMMEVHAPRTCNWLDTITEIGDQRGACGQTQFGEWWPNIQSLPETSKALLRFISQTYIPLGQVTAASSIKREKWFEVKLRGIATRFSTFHYRAWAFEQVQLRYQALPNAVQAELAVLLEEAGILPQLSQEILHNGLFDGFTPPFVRNGIADNRIKHLKERK